MDTTGNKRDFCLGFHEPPPKIPTPSTETKTEPTPTTPPEAPQLKPTIPSENEFGLTPYELLKECRDAEMKEVVKLVDLCADVRSMLILGENGTGKELIARALHERSNRSKGPLEIVDCTNLSPALIRSELFGHEKGAFTGAHQRHIGAFERANGGTIFLDEIGELPLELQGGLLRVLQGHRFTRIGGVTPIYSNFRLIAATNRNIEEMVGMKEFREDLYFRIAQFTIEVPPLRKRVDDLVRLASLFVDHCSHHKKSLSVAAEELIKSHSWPGNVRELYSSIERGVLFSNGTGFIEPADLKIKLRTCHQSSLLADGQLGEGEFTVMELGEMNLIQNMLREVRGNKLEAARRLGIGRQTLYNKLKKYKIHQYL